MKITIESRDRQALMEALAAQIRFWFKTRNQCQAEIIREYHRSETRAAVRLLRAAKEAA